MTLNSVDVPVIPVADDPVGEGLEQLAEVLLVSRTP
jgi:hypothetical protein